MVILRFSCSSAVSPPIPAALAPPMLARLHVRLQNAGTAGAEVLRIGDIEQPKEQLDLVTTRCEASGFIGIDGEKIWRQYCPFLELSFYSGYLSAPGSLSRQEGGEADSKRHGCSAPAPAYSGPPAWSPLHLLAGEVVIQAEAQLVKNRPGQRTRQWGAKVAIREGRAPRRRTYERGRKPPSEQSRSDDE